jgi:hydrogenase 3 maturation protease
MNTLKFRIDNDILMPFTDDLSAFLKGCRKLILVGMGNELRHDDAVGGKLVLKLRGKVPKGVELIDCGTTPEVFSSRFKRSEPTHIIFFDAVQMGKEPGFFGFVDEDTLASQSLSSHKQSVKMLFTVLRQQVPDLRIGLVGVEPKSTEFGTGLSAPVKRALNLLADTLKGVIGDACHEDDRVEG